MIIEEWSYMIELRGVSKVYRNKKGVKVQALKNIDLTLPSKGLVFIVGKSGSGKSTLLNLLGTLDHPTEGTIYVDGKKLTKKMEEAYRNQYIGFIFQEFHVFDEYTVYDNIGLSLRLQKKHPSKEKIERLLETLGLDGLEHRKPNELSGGQKQKVAVARALVKNPMMILADEPTGNLDVKSSAQLFDILTAISKTKLVVVVSHDLESARKYADRVIEISDGRIVQDVTLRKTEPHLQIFPKIKKSHLPFFYRFQLVLHSLFSKPLHLLMTLLLLICSFVFTAFLINSGLFHQTDLTINTMKANHKHVYEIKKQTVDYDGMIAGHEMTDTDKKELEKELGHSLSPKYTLKHENEILRMPFLEDRGNGDYYENLPSFLNFVEVKDSHLWDNVIGRVANKENEIVIHKYMADCIIEVGIKDKDGKEYHPENYQQIVSEKRPFRLGENEVVIVGIIDDDNQMWKKLKETGTYQNDEERNLFAETVDQAMTIYTNGFVEKAKITLSDEGKLKLLYMDIQNQYISDFHYLENTVTVYGNEKTEDISDLSKNDIVLSFDTLLQIYPNLNHLFETYTKEHSDLSYQDLQKKFLEEKKDFIPILKQSVAIDYGIEKEMTVYVRGIHLGEGNYVARTLLQDIQVNLKPIYSYVVYENDYQNMKRIFKKYPLSDTFQEHETYEGYVYQVPYQLKINNTTNTYRTLSKIIMIVGLIVLFFTLLLFTHFITTTIRYNKKKIGIFRAIGTRKRDIVKIFSLESFVISLFSYVVAMGIWYGVVYLLNQSVGSTLYQFEPFYINPYTYLFMFLFSVVLAICITILSLSKILKIQPIDAIQNK